MTFRITFIGAGYVGLVSGACLAAAGHQVTVVDVNAERVERINRGESVIYEPGLDELLKRVVGKTLTATTDLAKSLADSDAVFIAVGTPSRADGTADMGYVDAAAQAIAKYATRSLVVVNKSTVPVGSGDRVARLLAEGLEEAGKSWQCPVVSNPEFLREGCAINDFSKPERVVIGSDDAGATQLMLGIYQAMGVPLSKIKVMSRVSAEITKYAANTFLAARIALTNELAALAEEVGGDIDDITTAVGLDSRVGPQFMEAGPGYGGSCFPKDVQSLAHSLKDLHLDATLCEAVHTSNNLHKQWPWHAFAKGMSKRQTPYGQAPEKPFLQVGIWGLAFKADTDDVRDAASLDLVPRLLNAGHRVYAYDPQANHTFGHAFQHGSLCLMDSAEEVLKEVDVLIILTPWQVFRRWTPQQLAEALPSRWVIDARRLFDCESMAEAGFHYVSVGRAEVLPSSD